MNQPEQSSGCGKTLMGCGIFVVVLVLLIGIGAYVAMFHSPLPARGIVSLLNKSPDVQIEGVSGSLSSGFSVKTIRLTDSNGNVNALDDASLRYDQDGDSFIITELNVGRGHFYFDSSTATVDSDSGFEMSDGENQVSYGSSGGNDVSLIVQSASINDVKVEDVATGEVFHLKGIQLENLEIGKSFSLGKFVIDSTNCQVKIIPKLNDPTSYTISANLSPDFHERVIAPVTLEGSFDSSGSEAFGTLKLSLMNGTIEMIQTGKDNKSGSIRGLDPAEFIADLPPIGQINLDYKGSATNASLKGDLLFAGKKFVVDQSEVIDPNASPKPADPPIAAIHEAGDTRFRLLLADKDNDDKLVALTLESKPEMTSRQALAALLFGKAPAELGPEEKQRLEAVGQHLEAFE